MSISKGELCPNEFYKTKTCAILGAFLVLRSLGVGTYKPVFFLFEFLEVPHLQFEYSASRELAIPSPPCPAR